jgi:hypothetical protein
MMVRFRAALAMNDSLFLLMLPARNAFCTTTVLLRRLHRLQDDDGLFQGLARQLLPPRDELVKGAY